VKQVIFVPKVVFGFLLAIVFVSVSGCNSGNISSTAPLPASHSIKSIGLYPFKNYTDTPRAGFRAANIAEGVMLSKGYDIRGRLYDASSGFDLKDQLADARQYGFKYILVGAVSEWRYKTGIDGEPAISLQMKMIETKTKKIVWSVTGSDSSWGNASIGTLAHELLESMLIGKQDLPKQ